MAKGTATLAFAARGRVVLWLLGQLLLPLAVLAVVPLLVALAFGDFEFALRSGEVAVAFASIGWLLTRIDAARDVRPNEAMVATALIFLIAAGAMTWPLAGDGLVLLDAWFESASAITTTGLTALGDVESRSPAFLFLRAWMQWYGGLAITVLALALVLAPGIAARRLAGPETDVGDVIGGTRTRARHALVLYSGFTALAFVVLVLAGVAPFDALLHALATVSTGGFSSHNDSLAGLGGPGVQTIVILLTLCGAVSLMLYVRAWKSGWRNLVEDADLRAILLAGAAAALLVGLCMVLVDGRPWREAVQHAPLLAFSAQTTSGFSTTEVAALDPGSKLVLIGAMFVGGDTGSTAGGIKIGRFLVLLALLRYVLLRSRTPPHAVAEPTLAGHRLEGAEVYAALAIVFLHVTVIALSWLLFLAGGHAPLDALFEVTSAIGTVGLSSGLTGPELAASLKVLLTLDMLLGRLEVVAFIVLLYPPTWFGRRAEAS